MKQAFLHIKIWEANSDKNLIPRSAYNNAFKYFKFYNISPKNGFIKYIQREKGQTRARFKPTAHRLLAYALTDKATWKVIRIHACTG